MKGAQKNIQDLLRERCADAPISYRDYIELVLYSDGCGYYKRERERVGRSPERDFYTAESLGSVFAQLVMAAVAHIMSDTAMRQSTFVEIAAEPGAELLSHIDTHPFADSKVIRQGQAIEADGPVVIFANEWLDALPFHRLIFRDGVWRERGVIVRNGRPEEVLMDELTPELTAQIQRLPAQVPDGYELDFPLQAEIELNKLLAQKWSGLILLFDYGKSWQALLEDCPGGTARTYHKHKQCNDLLSQPGEKDITCDVNWTPLQTQMQAAGLEPVTLESQESFFVQRGQRAAEAIVSAAAWSFSKERQTLMELIHPAHMGRRFQVLWGLKKPQNFR